MPRCVPTSLAEARKAATLDGRPITQRAIARLLDVSPAYMCYMEQGRMLPTRAELVKIAKTYRVDPASLYPEPWSGALLRKGSE
jgi:transcriptional regulator with XRE-family HTH domain